MLWITLLTSPIQNVFLRKLNHIFCRDHFCFHLLLLSFFFFAIFMGNIWKSCLNDELIYEVQLNFTVFRNRIYVNILNLKKKMIIIIKSSAKGHYKPSAFIYLCIYVFIYLFIFILFTKFVDHHLNTYD